MKILGINSSQRRDGKKILKKFEFIAMMYLMKGTKNKVFSVAAKGGIGTNNRQKSCE